MIEDPDSLESRMKELLSGGGYRREEFIVDKVAVEGRPSHVADLDIVNMYNMPIYNINDLDVSDRSRFISKYGLSGYISRTKMAEMLSTWDHNGLARIEGLNYIADVKLSKKLTRNYKLLGKIAKQNKQTHGDWLRFNVDLFNDVLVIPTENNLYAYYLG